MEKLTAEQMCRVSVSEFRESRKMPVIVVADNIRSLNNIGSMFRTCDAFAVEALWLCGISATPPDKEIHKTALGAEESVEWRYLQNTVDAVIELKTLGYTVLCVEQVKGSIMLNCFIPETDKKYALVLGNEVKGVEQQALNMSDGALEIPQFGTKHSLNVSVATGVVLWEMIKNIAK